MLEWLFLPTGILYFLISGALFVFGLNYIYISLRTWHAGRSPAPPPEMTSPWPQVTVQLPIFNEFYVVERLIQTVADLDYPKSRLQIQVLDDSTDETVALVRRVVAQVRARGIDIVHVHRTDRTGYKAGALQAAMDSVTGEFIAILDADGVILETNRAWQRFASHNDDAADGDHSIGVNYLSVCDAAEGSGARDAHNVAEGIRQVIRGDVDEFLYDYPCHSPSGKHWYYMRAVRTTGREPLRVVVSHEDITALKLTEEALRRSRQTLNEQARSLEESNIALKVLLDQRDRDRQELERKVLSNVKGLVLPYVEKLKGARLKPRERTLVDIVEAHLQDIISPLLQSIANADIILTPQEMQVAALIKDGRSSKEIAQVLHISEATVNFHRKNLRVKFGLTNRRVNLRSYLLSMS